MENQAQSQTADLSPENQAQARAHCDQPGGQTRAEFVEEARKAKRARLARGAAPPAAAGAAPSGGGAAAPAGPGQQQPPRELDDDGQGLADLPEDREQLGQHEGYLQEDLQNMEWWDAVTYDELRDWVPTLGNTPKDVHHGLAALRGTVCKEIILARDLDDAVAEGRACKLLTFLDRLILATPRRRGKKEGALSPLIASRLRVAWQGGWGAL